MEEFVKWFDLIEVVTCKQWNEHRVANMFLLASYWCFVFLCNNFIVKYNHQATHNHLDVINLWTFARDNLPSCSHSSTLKKFTIKWAPLHKTNQQAMGGDMKTFRVWTCSISGREKTNVVCICCFRYILR
jgi:hypothetical protein